MDRDAVLARLMLLTEDDRTSRLETLAGDAARMVEARLRCTEAEAAANAEALTAAAAAYAAYQLALVDASCAPDSLTAGDVRAEYKTTAPARWTITKSARRRLPACSTTRTFTSAGCAHGKHDAAVPPGRARRGVRGRRGL